MFEAKGDEVSERRKLSYCYSSRNVIRKIKLKNIRRAAFTERIEKKDGYGMFVKKSEEGRPF